MTFLFVWLLIQTVIFAIFRRFSATFQLPFDYIQNKLKPHSTHLPNARHFFIFMWVVLKNILNRYNCLPHFFFLCDRIKIMNHETISLCIGNIFMSTLYFRSLLLLLTTLYQWLLLLLFMLLLLQPIVIAIVVFVVDIFHIVNNFTCCSIAERKQRPRASL